VLTLKARLFSKIKGKIQYNQRKNAIQPKEKVSSIEGMAMFNQIREPVHGLELNLEEKQTPHGIKSCSGEFLI
jgi:hypothetical protein